MKSQRQRKNSPPSSHRSYKSRGKSGNSSRSRDDGVQRESERLRALEERLEQLLRQIEADTSQKNGSASEDRLKKVEELLEKWQSGINEETGSGGEKQQERLMPIHQTIKPKQRRYVPFKFENEASASQYTKFFNVTVNQEDTRRINSYALRNAIKVLTGATLQSITTSGKDSFDIKVRNEEQSKKVVSLQKIGDIKCKVDRHRYYNQTKGLIYIHEFNIENIETFKNELQEEYSVANVELATFIKARNKETKVFILTFEQDVLPEYIYVPGERADTKVYSFMTKPKFCKQC